MRPYFAAEQPYSPAIATRIMEKVDRWYEQLPALRSYQRARRIRQAYYGLPSDASPFDVTTIAALGQAGELSALNLNELGVLGQRILAMTVQDDLGWQPVAANMDASSQQDVAVARAVLEYERRTGQLDKVFATAAETAFLDASAWIAVRWDTRGGPKYDEVQDPTTGQSKAVYTGKLRVTLHPWWRTVVDLYRHDADHDWLILVDFHNRYDLAARFAPYNPSNPTENEALRTRILGLPREHPRVLESRQERNWLRWEDTDLVPVYSLYHRPTEALPEGREVWVVDAGTVLYDGAAIYGTDLPAVRIAPGEWLDTPHGHTPLSNLVAPQQALNMTVSSVVTNNANGAVAKWWIPAQSNLRRTEADGAEFWESDSSVPPQSLNMVGSSPETYRLAEVLKGLLVELAGLNPVSTGQQERAMSGALAALFDAKAREGIAPFIRSFRWAVEAVGTRIIECYKRFAKVPRALEVIMGTDRRYMLQDFTGQQLEAISRVSVEARNSMLDTTSGKIAFVENLLTMPAFQQNPRALGILYSIYTTGRIDALLLDPETESILIQRENEAIARGEEPPVRWEDNDEAHIAGHQRVSNNPESRLDEATMALLDQHLLLHRQQMMMKASGAMGPGMPPPVAPPAPPAGGPPPEAGAAPESPVPLEAPVDAGPNGPSLPSLPVNPATGERAPAPPN